eukprot:PhM_4_TR5680/c0_g1_i1/m.73914
MIVGVCGQPDVVLGFSGGVPMGGAFDEEDDDAIGDGSGTPAASNDRVCARMAADDNISSFSGVVASRVEDSHSETLDAELMDVERSREEQCRRRSTSISARTSAFATVSFRSRLSLNMLSFMRSARVRCRNTSSLMRSTARCSIWHCFSLSRYRACQSRASPEAPGPLPLPIPSGGDSDDWCTFGEDAGCAPSTGVFVSGALEKDPEVTRGVIGVVTPHEDDDRCIGATLTGGCCCCSWARRAAVLSASRWRRSWFVMASSCSSMLRWSSVAASLYSRSCLSFRRRSRSRDRTWLRSRSRSVITAAKSSSIFSYLC